MIATIKGGGGAWKARIGARNVGLSWVNLSCGAGIACSKLVCDVDTIVCEKIKAAPVRDRAVLEEESFDGDAEDIGSERVSTEERMYLGSLDGEN